MDVKGSEFGIGPREHANDHELDKLQWCHFGANVACVADLIATYCDACAIRVVFLGGKPCRPLWSM